MEFTPLTQEQARTFDRDGFLVIPNALPPALVDRLLKAADRLYREGRAADGLNAQNYAMPPDLLARCSPIQRQLLGACTSPMGYQIPQDDDVPLRIWLEEHTQRDLDPSKETPGAFTSDGVRR